MSDKKPLNLSLPVDLISDIKVVCIKRGLTVSEVVEQLLQDYIDHYEINMRSMEDPSK